MPIGPARMPLFDHLGELRMRLVRIVACLAVAVVVFYMATPTMGQFLLMPIAEFLPNVDGMASLQAIDPFEAFSVRFQISLWAGIVATSPVILWQLLAFFLPALKPSERKWFMPTFAAAVALFIIGTVFCYLVIFDVIPYKKLRGSWRTVYVVLMVICAVVTPDASPVTMLLMFAAMIALYEGSLLIARVVLGRRIKRQNERLAAEEDE